MYPSKANMYLAPLSDEVYVDEKINFWKNVYGFDYTCIMYVYASGSSLSYVSFPSYFATISLSPTYPLSFSIVLSL